MVVKDFFKTPDGDRKTVPAPQQLGLRRGHYRFRRRGGQHLGAGPGMAA